MNLASFLADLATGATLWAGGAFALSTVRKRRASRRRQLIPASRFMLVPRDGRPRIEISFDQEISLTLSGRGSHAPQPQTEPSPTASDLRRLANSSIRRR
ncbi:hypothetical protein KHC28_00260 [Ancylobacter sonchi]|uniref:hypothetical protein n=1 Tax=Ancylobacter sonchi TaxID=1937790 RepID=UPI001BD5CF43|nr:hypothetical protein [Ancylobacter sonchi]MBS7532097.1 hypothetical protein [Ancylobacter sonchi]